MKMTMRYEGKGGMSAKFRKGRPVWGILGGLMILSGGGGLAGQGTAGEVYDLEQFEVVSFQREYRINSTETALGLEAELLDTPLTVASIPMDILTDQQVNNVEDALRNVGGVTKFKQGNGGEEKFSIRGFDASQSLYKDGARINNAFNATNIATTETANIERYDVLKGPAAILYGEGEPGGVINYITKKPLFNSALQSFEFIIGSYDYYRAELDLAGPFRAGPDAGTAYRLVSSYEDSDSHRDFLARERWLVAPSLTWKIGGKTTATLQYEYITDTYTQDRGQVLEGNATDGYRYTARQDSSQFYGVPGWNENTNSDYQRFALLLDHRFSEAAVLSVRASSARVEKVLFDSSPGLFDFGTFTTVGPEGDTPISPRLQGGDGKSDSVTVHYRHELEGGHLGGQTLRHKLLLGADFERIDNDGFSSQVLDAQGNRVRTITYNIVTGEYTGIPEGGLFAGSRSPGVQTDTYQTGLVIQDLISLGEEWHVLAGLRYTEFDNRDADVKNTNWSPRSGLVYRPDGGNLSWYASWAQGFTPTTATGQNPETGTGIGGPVLDPERTGQVELGLRWNGLEDNLTLTAALFDLRKKDIVVTDPASLLAPADERWAANLGETRTRGFDLQVIGRLSPEIRIIAGYAWLDNALLEVDPEAPSLALVQDHEGNRLPGIPRHSGNLWAVYEFAEGPAEGLGLGLGVFAQTETYISTENWSTYDSWIQVDAMAYYKKDNWKVQVNVSNLTDEEYNLAQAGTTSDVFAAIRAGTSDPLTIKASLALEF